MKNCGVPPHIPILPPPPDRPVTKRVTVWSHGAFGQGEGEPRAAAAGQVFGRDPPALPLHNALRQRQADTGVAASRPPLTPKLTTPQEPLGRYFLASSW